MKQYNLKWSIGPEKSASDWDAYLSEKPKFQSSITSHGKLSAYISNDILTDTEKTNVETFLGVDIILV